MSAEAAAAALKAAQAAWAHRDDSAALAHLQKARAEDLAAALADIGLLQAEVLRQTGQFAATDTVLARVQAEHPGDFWPLYHRARLARQRKDLPAAWAHLGAARANAAENPISLDLLEAELLEDTGQPEAAEALLRAVVDKHPRTLAAYLRLAALAEARDDLAAAHQALEAAVKIDPSRMPLQFDLVRLSLETGRPNAAIARLETLRARHGPQPQIMMKLAGAFRQSRQDAREIETLSTLLRLNPQYPPLLRHLFSTRAKEADPAVLEAVLDLVRRKQGTDLADALEVPMRLQQLDFTAALRAIRATRQSRRSAAEAQSLASALFGAHHYRLGWRYLRACLRRWPENQGFWGMLVHQGGRLGRAEAVSDALDDAAAQLPARRVTEFRLTLSGYRDDLEGAIACFAELHAQGAARPPQRWLLHKMLFNLAGPDEAAAFYDRFGPAVAAESKPLHRVGLPGSMAMEFELERAELARLPKDISLKDWTLARPESSAAAIRLIDAWRTTPPCPPAGASKSETRPIPRRIYQYWDSAPPAAITEMTAHWAAAPGFEHRLFDRREARIFLAETFGKSWVRAFDMANNAAQEADLLRLALLTKTGGIWADADDVLYGDLDRLLASGPGLIVYREPQGGALGNNFLAAPPAHPVLAYAAQVAVEALTARSSDLAWFKTGPGLLTRAVGLFLAKADPDVARRQITILDWPALAGEIATHNPAAYKSSDSYWNRKDERGAPRPPDLWDQLLAGLQGNRP